MEKYVKNEARQMVPRMQDTSSGAAWKSRGLHMPDTFP